MEQSQFPTLFITLTYNNENLPYTLDEKPIIRKHYGEALEEVTLLTRDVQLFTKSLRKCNAKHTTSQMRYYAAGEYGGKYGRPHYHFIIFNLHPKAMLQIGALWKRGIVDVQECRSSEKVSCYVAGYIVNAYSHAKRLNKRPFSLMSKKPFLGHTYVARMRHYHKSNLLPYLERGIHKQALPKIFKEKIFEKWELNSMKQPAFVQSELAIEAELHRLELLGHLDPLNSYYATRIHNEQQIIRNGKHSDHYDYHIGGVPALTANPLTQNPDRKPKVTKTAYSVRKPQKSQRSTGLLRPLPGPVLARSRSNRYFRATCNQIVYEHFQRKDSDQRTRQIQV